MMSGISVIRLAIISLQLAPFISGATLNKNSQQSCEHWKSYDFRRHSDGDLARTFAPIVYFDKGEKYYPSSMEYFLQHVKMIRKDGSVVQRNPKIHNIKEGKTSYSLVSIRKLKCPSCTNLPFLKGKKKSVPVYAVTRRTKKFVDIIYWMLYPYNRGKPVCIGIAAKRVCWGLFKNPCIKVLRGCAGHFATFGHHVGDWEHISIRISVNGPSILALSAHNFGGIYKFNECLSRFEKNGENVFMRGSHPIVYSAKGSHGLWHKPGTHKYKDLCNGGKLSDLTSKGIQWRTWEHLKVTSWKKNGDYQGAFRPFKFLGRWGNRERGCGIIKKLSGQCVLNGGPTGPRHKRSMQIVEPLSDHVEMHNVADILGNGNFKSVRDADLNQRTVAEREFSEKVFDKLSRMDDVSGEDDSTAEDHFMEKRGFRFRRIRRKMRLRRIGRKIRFRRIGRKIRFRRIGRKIRFRRIGRKMRFRRIGRKIRFRRIGRKIRFRRIGRKIRFRRIGSAFLRAIQFRKMLKKVKQIGKKVLKSIC